MQQSQAVSLIGAAFLGGLIAAGSVLLFCSQKSTAQDSMDSEIAQLQGSVAELQLELEQMKDRVRQLGLPRLAAGTASSDLEETGQAPAQLPEALKRAILEQAREVGREALSSAERESALRLALGQLQSSDAEVRRSGVRRLRRMFAEEAKPQVLTALYDESALVRKEAAIFFEKMWDTAALEPLVELAYGESKSVATHALEALCKSRDSDAIAEVEEYFLNGPRLEVVYEVGKILDKENRRSSLAEGLQRFRKALDSSEAADRRIAVAALGRWGSEHSDAAAIRAMLQDSSSRVRKQVKKALKAWGRD